jgi:hypothetical protein
VTIGGVVITLATAKTAATAATATTVSTGTLATISTSMAASPVIWATGGLASSRWRLSNLEVLVMIQTSINKIL